MMPGVPERRSHDYVRHGTTGLFARVQHRRRHRDLPVHQAEHRPGRRAGHPLETPAPLDRDLPKSYRVAALRRLTAPSAARLPDFSSIHPSRWAAVRRVVVRPVLGVRPVVEDRGQLAPARRCCRASPSGRRPGSPRRCRCSSALAGPAVTASGVRPSRCATRCSSPASRPAPSQQEEPGTGRGRSAATLPTRPGNVKPELARRRPCP